MEHGASESPELFTVEMLQSRRVGTRNFCHRAEYNLRLRVAVSIVSQKYLWGGRISESSSFSIYMAVE